MDPNVSDIILSAGHGAGDPGACAQGTTERELNIKVTDLVISKLWSKFNYTCLLVPHSVGDLQAEIDQTNAWAKTLESALAIQIHFNAGGGTGEEVWYPSNGDDRSKDQAMKVSIALAAATGLRNRGIKDASTNGWGKLGWTDDTNCYALLIECAFIDVDRVDDAYLDQIAEGISNGIGDIFGATQNVPAPVPTPVIVPVPTPAPVGINYRVTISGVQVGAYSQLNNAYLKYVSTGRVGVIKDAAGNDVTAKTLLEFEPKVEPIPIPVPIVVPTPVEAPITADEVAKDTNTRVKGIQAAIQWIIDFIKSTFNIGKK